jgi:hypothetical protein
MLEAFVPPSAILGREVIPLTEERIHVRGDGRDISAIVMLPDNITGQLSAILSTWRSTILAAVPDGSPE